MRDPLTTEKIAEITAALNKRRLSLHDEKVLQNEIELIFREKNIWHLREHHLSAKDILDFMLSGVALEVKLKASTRDLYRQISRYLQHDSVRGLVLVTNKYIRLPAQINNKPVTIIRLGQSWL
jgi:hypothetical protein